MECAIYNGIKITATDVTASIDKELKIKIASEKGLLKCPDPECPEPQLKYCHGERKIEYFSHVHNKGCTYATFDEENTQEIRYIQRKLYLHFKKLGYNIEEDKKIFSNHYTHLFFKDETPAIAIEIISQKNKASKINELQTSYDVANIRVCWIFIGSINSNQTEKDMMFGKRFPINKTKNNQVIVIEKEGVHIQQLRYDTKEYKYEDNKIAVTGFDEIYNYNATVNELTIENKEINIKNFNKNFQQWLIDKQKKYKIEINKIKIREQPQKPVSHISTTFNKTKQNTQEDQQTNLQNNYPQINYKLEKYQVTNQFFCRECGQIYNDNQCGLINYENGKKLTGICINCLKHDF